ncbi:hypothetical protein Gotur_013022, partial [Gossypium turneri]
DQTGQVIVDPDQIDNSRISSGCRKGVALALPDMAMLVAMVVAARWPTAIDHKHSIILVGNGDLGTDVSRMYRSIYFDAAFDQQHARSASGLIVRGEGGEILVSKSVIHNNIATPFAAEAHAGLKALQLGRSMAFKDIQILGDSKTIIRKCQSSEQDRSVIGAIINDIQEIKTSFNRISFCFISRTKIFYAHAIATEALRKGEGHYLDGAIPITIRRTEGRVSPRVQG